MALSSYNAIATWTRLFLRTEGGPSESGGAVTGYPEANGGTGATLAGNAPVYVADPLGDGSGPSARVDSGDSGFETGVQAGSSEDFTAFGIFRPTLVTGDRAWIATTTAPGLYAYHSGSSFYLYDDESTDFEYQADVAANTNYAVVLTRISGVVTCYINGSAGASTITSASTPTFEFGSDIGGGNPLRGHFFGGGILLGEGLTGADLTALHAANAEELAGTGDPSGPEYELTGQVGAIEADGGDAVLTVARLLTGEVGAIEADGGDATLTVARLLTAQVGAIEADGGDATLTVARLLTAQVGAIEADGGDAVLTVARLLTAQVGAIEADGGDATLTVHRVLVGQVGAIEVGGGDAELTIVAPEYDYELVGLVGAIEADGGDVMLTVHRVLVGEVGAIEVGGGDAVLTVAVPGAVLSVAAETTLRPSAGAVASTTLRPSAGAVASTTLRPSAGAVASTTI